MDKCQPTKATLDIFFRLFIYLAVECSFSLITRVQRVLEGWRRGWGSLRVGSSCEGGKEGVSFVYQTICRCIDGLSETIRSSCLIINRIDSPTHWGRVTLNRVNYSSHAPEAVTPSTAKD